MTTDILIIAHAPLATALRDCAQHVFAGAHGEVVALDVVATESFERTLDTARKLMAGLDGTHTLVLTDLFGATPCNVAQKIVDGVASRLIAGVNVPMVLRALTYRGESLDALVGLAMSGATHGVMQVASVAPQNQARKKNDQDHHDHQQ